MRHARKLLTFVGLLIVLTVMLPAQDTGQEKPKPPIPNFIELAPLIGTGGQPSEAGIKLAADKGYKSIINIRTSSEGVDLAAEEKQAMQLGLKYYMIPFDGREPREAQALAFNALMAALKGEKVFVHCGSGNRVGSLLMIYFALVEGLPVEQAEQEAKKAGLRTPELLEFAQQVIARHKKNPVA
jgi:uncharacterized protein (TIGR01244 family)